MKRFAWMVANAVNVSLDCNSHKASYRTADQEFQDDPRNFADVDDAERAECITKDQICQLFIYPDKPVCSVVFIHADPEVCVERGYQWLLRHRAAAENS